jgi:hypothetical protein
MSEMLSSQSRSPGEKRIMPPLEDDSQMQNRLSWINSDNFVPDYDAFRTQTEGLALHISHAYGLSIPDAYIAIADCETAFLAERAAKNAD